MRLLLLPTTTTTTSSSSSILSSLLLLSRLFSSLPKLKNLCYRHRPRALIEARHALTDYLHQTRSIPFSHAELIASNSPFSLSTLVSQIPFSSDSPPSLLPRTLRRFLSFHPINEFDFFFESIGLPPSPPLPSPGLFLSDDSLLLSAVSSLVQYGFPWTKLGFLYREEPSVFRRRSDYLVARLRGFEALGLDRVCVIGICLAFPSVLSGDDGLPGGEIDLLLQDLKRLFVDFGLAVSSGDNVEVSFQVCRRIRVFYDVGSAKGKMGELLGSNGRVFLEFEEQALAQKLNFFFRLGLKREEIGMFVLQHPEILDFDLENAIIAMPGYLRRIGLDEEELARLCRKYPYVMGRNRLGNLPGLMRAMDLREWFIGRIMNGNHHYLSSAYASTASDDMELDKDFREDLEKLKSIRKHQYVANKLDFLLGIGFGENLISTKVLRLLNSTRSQFQERFDCLLGMGIEYHILCRMISVAPKILNQNADMLHEKVNYLCHDLNCSLDYLDNFPAFLCFDLENRVKPRYRILNWLRENGLLKTYYSPATILATSEKKFVANLLTIHPAAPKQWLESFSSRSECDGIQRIRFPHHSLSIPSLNDTVKRLE